MARKALSGYSWMRHADRGAVVVAREQRRLAELGDVGQHRHLHRVDEASCRWAGRRRPRRRCRRRPASTQAIARSMAASTPSAWIASVRAIRKKSGLGLGIGGGLDAVDHLFGRDTISLPGPMAAALGADLVLDVAGGGAGLDQRLDGALDVEGAGAEAGVDVDQQRHIAHIGDAAHIDQHVVHRVDAQVGQAQGARGHAAAREVDGAITSPLGQQRVVGVDGADDLQRRFFGKGLAKTRARGQGRVDHKESPGGVR